MKRVMCVWFPNWPIQRWRRAQPSVDGRPVVLFMGMGRGGPRVTACSRAARKRGARPGMLLAEARALCGLTIQCEPHDPPADREALRGLARTCELLAPRIALDPDEPPDCLLFDIAGCDHHFGGERALGLEAIATLRRRGYFAAVAIADTIGAAWALAHYHPALRSLSHRDDARLVVVAPNRHVEALRALPVEALRLSPSVVALLREFDVRRIGQLMELSRPDLPSRFGPELLRQLDRATGAIPELLTPERPEEILEASWDFDPPVGDGRALDATIQHLLEYLFERLRPRRLGVQRLRCTLDVAGHEAVIFTVGVLRPSLSTKHLSELIRLHVERLSVPAEIAGVIVRAERVASPEFRQSLLFDDGASREHEVLGLLERLTSRLGEKAVLRPVLRADPQPEFACQFQSECGIRTAEEAANLFQLHAPLWLLSPVAVSVSASNERVAGVRWQRRRYAIVHSWGPERIETGWWRGADVQRDYYLVEAIGGERFWLFRPADDDAWYVHGEYA